MEKLTQQIDKLSIKSQQKRLLVIYNRLNELHTSSKKHPETPQRIKAIIQQLQTFKNIHLIEANEAITEKLLQKLSDSEIQALIIQVQGEHYYEFIKEMWDQNIKKNEMYINTDTYYMKHTYKAAFQAVKATLMAMNYLIKNKCNYFYSVIRPPGHHSGMKSQPHGFSFYNNLAIAANYWLQNNKNKKIAILDWDVHHGEGTQQLFYKRKDVLYLSLHRYDNGKFFPHIPQSSSVNVGEGQGIGFNVNICWNTAAKKPGQTYSRDETVGDEEYVCAFNKIIIPIFKQYCPDLILVSCGFDSGDGDAIGNLKLSKYGYMFMTNELRSLGKDIGFVLEGGYNLDVLKWGSNAVVSVLTDCLAKQDEQVIHKLKQSSQANKIGEQGIKTCLNNIQKYWKILKQ